MDSLPEEFVRDDAFRSSLMSICAESTICVTDVRDLNRQNHDTPFENFFQVFEISSSGFRDRDHYMSKKLAYARGDVMSVVLGNAPYGGSKAGEVGVPQEGANW